MKRIIATAAAIFALGCTSSGDDNSATSGSDFDRGAMLANWADNIIIPAYTDYQAKVNDLSAKTAQFNAAPDESKLRDLRTAWISAYTSYQGVANFYLGKAEDISFKEASNTFPTEVSGINANISGGTYNLALSTEFKHAGFPALDYLLNGIGDSDAGITSYYTTSANAARYKQYLTDVVARLKFAADAIVADWTGSYRSTFIASSGTSVTSSASRLTNAFVKTFERDIRSAKVGIPAGKLSAGTLYPEKVEALYKGDLSRTLLIASVKASQDFFNGKHFSDSGTGPSLKSYLDYVNAVRDGQQLSTIISNQFQATLDFAATVDPNFSNQVTTDNSKMLQLYDDLQQSLVYLKLDMMQALNITIDYVDGDGD